MPLSDQQGMYFPMVGGNPMAGSFTTLQQPGHLGKKFEYNVGTEDKPLWVTLRLVKLAAVTAAIGEVLYWSDRDDYVVTNVADGGVIAGIVPAGTGAVAPSSGGYFFMVVKGRLPVKYLDSVTIAPDTAGKLAVGSATNGRADCVTDGSAVVNLILGRTAGTQDTGTKLATTDINVFDQA